jgi:hypothetical protein
MPTPRNEHVIGNIHAKRTVSVSINKALSTPSVDMYKSSSDPDAITDRLRLSDPRDIIVRIRFHRGATFTGAASMLEIDVLLVEVAFLRLFMRLIGGYWEDVQK